MKKIVFCLSTSVLLSATSGAVQAASEEEPAETLSTKYIVRATNQTWEGLEYDPAIYDNPYKVSLFDPQNGEDSRRLWSQTKSIFGYGFAVLGVIAALPEEFTGWGSGEDSEPFKKWGRNLSEVAVWDRDEAIVNYIGHPYFGGVYYQSARKSGYRQWDAFIYSTMMSTFYWEYGVEAFAEIPSIQDLVVTPVLGWVYGEWAFNKEQQIEQRGTVYGSQRLASAALFMLDPVDTLGTWVNRGFGRQVVHAGTGYVRYGDVPLGDSPNAPTEKQVMVGVNFTIGQSNERSHSKRYHAITNDPVDTGIVGISTGLQRILLDDDWGMEDGDLPVTTLGLHFTPELSLRLRYGRTKLDRKDGTGRLTYENYGLDGQYYFNTDADTRPFVNVGVGEEMFDKDRDRKYILWNAGLGVHQKLTDKLAIQALWQNYYSPSKKTYEQSISAQLIYRFAAGEA